MKQHRALVARYEKVKAKDADLYIPTHERRKRQGEAVDMLKKRRGGGKRS
jgi:hypothetical protein